MPTHLSLAELWRHEHRSSLDASFLLLFVFYEESSSRNNGAFRIGKTLLTVTREKKNVHCGVTLMKIHGLFSFLLVPARRATVVQTHDLFFLRLDSRTLLFGAADRITSRPPNLVELQRVASAAVLLFYFSAT